MTILHETPERNWNSNQPLDGPFTVAPEITLIRLTCTRVNWPVGKVAVVSVDFNGVTTGAVFNGGDNFLRGVLQLTSSVTFSKEPGVTAGTFHVAMSQNVRSAILIEGF